MLKKRNYWVPYQLWVAMVRGFSLSVPNRHGRMHLLHRFAGVSLSFLSMIGFVALSGVVVNDSLIFVEFYNAKRSEGECLHTALLHAGGARLRPIFLTTITTVLGLTPLMLEQSMQAKFLIPMALAISFGLMSATVLILLLLPALLVIGEDIQHLCSSLWNGTNDQRL